MSGKKTILDDFFLIDGWTEFVRRLDNLDEADLTYQCDLISTAFSMRYPDTSHQNDPEKVKTWRSASHCSKEQFLDEASAIAHEIAKKAMNQNGKVSWLCRQFDPMTHLLNIGSTDSGLYEGTMGIGLFLACWEQLSGDKQYHELAEGCFKPAVELKDWMKTRKGYFPFSLGLGTGIGGIVWSLVLAGQMLDNPSLSDLALDLVQGVDLFFVENDAALDVMSGAAGLILTLVNCFLDPVNEYETTSDAASDGKGERNGRYVNKAPRSDLSEEVKAKLTKLANRCGEKLLETRSRFNQRMLWPSTYAHQPLTGFAHGAAGYACALLKLYRVTGDNRFRAAALESIEYERSVFVPREKNWPDFRVHRDLPEGQTAYMAGWCAGAPGIGMARLMTLEQMDTAETRDEIKNAVAFTSSQLFSPDASDHYCCGNAGRVDFLLQAGMDLNRPELLDLAIAGGSYMVHRAKDLGHYTFSGDNNGPIFSPGLFTGLAGVGWTLMRLASPTLASLMAPTAKIYS